VTRTYACFGNFSSVSVTLSVVNPPRKCRLPAGVVSTLFDDHSGPAAFSKSFE